MSPDPSRMGRSHFTSMGAEIVVEAKSQAALMDVADLFGEWERVFTRFSPDSELSRVNDSHETAVVVSEPFARAVRVALAAWKATGGLVDPTLATAVESAGYDRDFAALLLDDPRPAGPAVPGRANEVRLAGRLLMRPPGLRLDLAGVVKSLAVDEALALLPGAGFVSAGGDVATRGPATVGLPGGESLTLADGGLATSGVTARAWRRAGRLQHHLIDPRTGVPARTRWQQVTVAAGSCVGADVAAKAAFLLSDDGPDWLDEHGLPGRFVAEDDLVENDSWRDRLGEPAWS
jgi:thiamine biosynthesis lipoprotein